MASDVPLIDHHCHGVVATDLDRPAFESLLTESAHAAPVGTSQFDSPLGLAVRRWCASSLDLEPGCDPDAYLERRTDLGAQEVNRRLLTAAGLGALVVDTGYQPVHITAIDELAGLAGTRGYEVARIERIAEQLLDEVDAPERYPEAFEQALRDRAAHAVGFKSIVAYRGGLDLVGSPSRAEVCDAVRRVQALPGTTRLEDPVLLRFGLDLAGVVASERQLPVQFHTGYGDDDLQLDRADPLLLTPLIRQYAERGTTVALLHCYPYQRQAGYLAAVFPNVYFDVGLALPYLGASSERVLAEALELAPFAKQLYSSDAFGLAELYLIASRLFRRGMRRILDSWVAAGDCTATDADRILWSIGADNAHRIYQLVGQP